MHDKGQTVAEFEAQPDMFREQPSAEVMFLCRLFEANQKSPSGISGVLKEYAAQCKKIDTTTADLFGEEDPSKLDKLQAAYDHYATDLAQGMDNLRALDRGNSAYANFDERKLNDKETLKNLTPEEILERIKSVKSVSFPVERLDENFNLKYYWNWFEKNLLDREIPTAIRRNAVFKKGHFFKLIAGGKNKGFIKGYTTPEDAFKAIKKGKVLLHDKDLAPEGFSMARARQMPLVLDVLQDPFFVLKDKKTKDFIFLKKYEGGGNYVAVMFNANPLGIVSWQMRDFTLSNARRSTLEYQKNGVDFLAQPRESSMRDDSPKTLSESENNSENQENSSKKWREVSEPSPEEIAEANRQKAEVKAKWTNLDGSMKKGYHCAPNGKPSKLTEEQWLLVRTPNFKKWFGDWETLAIINEVENMPASAIKLHESLDKAGIKEAFKSFGEVENRRDGRVVVFPSASAGKIRRHKGFDSGTVIKNFKTLFETAIPAISEEEVLKDGHKAHGNIDAVEHYVNKFSANGNEYFIRFTVPVIRNNKGLDNIHSSAISEVSIYKNGDSTLYPLNTAGSSSPSFIDRKLADFLNSVKPENVSKVVDENGEPLVVYHGTENGGFTVFDKDLIASEGGFYFNDRKAVADEYAAAPDGHEPLGESKVYSVFLNMRNPYIKDFKGERYNEFWTEMDVVKEDGYDGFIAKNIVDNRFSDSENTIPSTDYVVRVPN